MSDKATNGLAGFFRDDSCNDGDVGSENSVLFDVDRLELFCLIIYEYVVKSDGLSSEGRRKIIDLCKAIIPDALIFLYGSRARGDYGERSDIDLALDAQRVIHYREMSELQEVLAAADMPYSFNIVDLNALKNDSYKKNVEKEKIL